MSHAFDSVCLQPRPRTRQQVLCYLTAAIIPSIFAAGILVTALYAAFIPKVWELQYTHVKFIGLVDGSQVDTVVLQWKSTKNRGSNINM